MNLRVRRLTSEARLPTRVYKEDAGLDLYAAENASLSPSGRAVVRTGIAVEIPTGYVGLIMPRSGRALEQGLTQVDAVGVIDSGYRGEVLLLLHNADDTSTISIRAGDRVSQLLVLPVTDVRVVEADMLSESERGPRGLGSTGR